MKKTESITDIIGDFKKFHDTVFPDDDYDRWHGESLEEDELDETEDRENNLLDNQERSYDRRGRL